MKSFHSPVYCRQKLGLVDGLSGRVSDRRELSTTPSNKANFWIKGNIGCPFVWFVYFGMHKFVWNEFGRQTPEG